MGNTVETLKFENGIIERRPENSGALYRVRGIVGVSGLAQAIENSAIYNEPKQSVQLTKLLNKAERNITNFFTSYTLLTKSELKVIRPETIPANLQKFLDSEHIYLGNLANLKKRFGICLPGYENNVPQEKVFISGEKLGASLICDLNCDVTHGRLIFDLRLNDRSLYEFKYLKLNLNSYADNLFSNLPTDVRKPFSSEAITNQTLFQLSPTFGRRLKFIGLSPLPTAIRA